MRRRDKRITLRFYLDDPEACELYRRLQQRRQETGKTMSALIMMALKEYLAPDNQTETGRDEAIRDLLRAEIRAALREWSLPPQAVAIKPDAEMEPGEDDVDPESILTAAGFTL